MATGWFWSADSRKARLRLRQVRERTADISPALNVWVDDVAEEVALNFASEGERFGHAWAALSPKYAAWKAMHYPGKTILRREDRLYESLTVRPMAVERITKDSATVGTNVPYAKYHQRGTSKMPSRPFLELTAELQRSLNNHVRDHITGKK